MSAWKVLLRNLHEKGGGPLPMRAFDPILGTSPDVQMQTAKRLGLVESHRQKFTWTWKLTERGRAWCEGRYELVETVDTERRCRGKRQLKASWAAVVRGI